MSNPTIADQIEAIERTHARIRDERTSALGAEKLIEHGYDEAESVRTQALTTAQNLCQELVEDYQILSEMFWKRQEQGIDAQP